MHSRMHNNMTYVGYAYRLQYKRNMTLSVTSRIYAKPTFFSVYFYNNVCYNESAEITNGVVTRMHKTPAAV